MQPEGDLETQKECGGKWYAKMRRSETDAEDSEQDVEQLEPFAAQFARVMPDPVTHFFAHMAHFV